MNHIEIREIQREDLKAILNLLAQPDMDDRPAFNEQEAQAVLMKIQATPNHVVFVAEVAGEIVGTFALCLVQHLAHRGARSAVVEDVVVKSAWQGRGVGKAMMQHATERARAAGCYKIMLSSGLGRAGSHRFYEGLGFERHGYSFLLPLCPTPTA